MASSDTPKTILLKGDPIHKEGLMKSGEAIKPGMLVTMHTDATIKKHATAAGYGPAAFAREDDYIGGGIDDTFANGENVPYYVCKPGDEIYAWLADTENVVIGETLESDGAGALRTVGSAGVAIARALEAVNNSAGGAIARIKVEVV